MKTYTITVDIMDNTSQDVHSLPVYNQGDINTSILNLNITQDDVAYDLTGSTVSVFFIKSDGTVVYQDSTNGLSVTNAIGGNVSVSLNTQTLAALGRVTGAVKIQNGSSTIETGGFYFVVKKSLTSDQALTSINEISAIFGSGTLATSSQDIKGAINELVSNKANQTDLNATNTTVATKADKTAIGDVTTLTTQNKTNVVAAINENVSSLADITTVNNHTITYIYNADGSVQSTTEKDSSNNTIKTVTYTYNVAGDVAQSITVMNGKTVTTTYNYDANANITSTSNVIS